MVKLIEFDFGVEHFAYDVYHNELLDRNYNHVLYFDANFREAMENLSELDQEIVLRAIVKTFFVGKAKEASR